MKLDCLRTAGTAVVALAAAIGLPLLAVSSGVDTAVATASLAAPLQSDTDHHRSP